MKYWLAGIILALAACATNLLGKQTQALEAVTASRQASTAALRAGKISVSQDQKIQAELDLVRASIDAGVKANSAPAVDAAASAAKALEVK